MKIFLIAAVLCYFSRVYSVGICFGNCVNVLNDASCAAISLTNRCRGNLRNMCALSCKVCSQCKPDANVPSSDGNTNPTSQPACEIEGCRDVASPQACSIIKHLYRCTFRSESCRRSCGICKPCPIPPPACILDCKDDDDSCEHWESLGYCKKSSEFYPFMSQKCPKSCKICKACPTPEPPNKDLPPTPQGCSENCVDTNKNSCGYWNDTGYCSQTKKYPHLLKVCALTCGACFPCPTSPCSKDCVDTNENCEHWEKKGYCESTDAHYLESIKLCPKSCGVCTACSKEKRNTHFNLLPPV